MRSINPIIKFWGWLKKKVELRDHYESQEAAATMMMVATALEI